MGREDLALVCLRFLVAFCVCSHKSYYVMVLLLAGIYCHRNSWGFWTTAACSEESWSEQWEEKFLRGGFNLFNFSCSTTKLKTSGFFPEYLYHPLLSSLSFSSPRLRCSCQFVAYICIRAGTTFTLSLNNICYTFLFVVFFFSFSPLYRHRSDIVRALNSCLDKKKTWDNGERELFQFSSLVWTCLYTSKGGRTPKQRRNLHVKCPCSKDRWSLWCL